MAEVFWHIEAVDDLDAAAAYIASSSPVNAVMFTMRVLAASERLAGFPMLGRPVPEIADASYRELIFQNYRIVYRVIGERIAVIGVVHAAMDMGRQVRERDWDIT